MLRNTSFAGATSIAALPVLKLYQLHHLILLLLMVPSICPLDFHRSPHSNPINSVIASSDLAFLLRTTTPTYSSLPEMEGATGLWSMTLSSGAVRVSQIRFFGVHQEAEISASMSFGANRNLESASKRGSTLLNLKCVDVQTGLMGKSLLELQSNKGDVLPAHKFGTHDVVVLKPNKSDLSSPALGQDLLDYGVIGEEEKEHGEELEAQICLDDINEIEL
ncbi:hypothetical protein LXL04_037351 [Taraxacum kok-saghyz]